MKYTLEQLHSKTNDELNEIVLQAQGWETTEDGELWSEDTGAITYGVPGYSPTYPTLEGAAHAFNLLIDCELEFSSAFKGKYKVYSLTDGSVFAEDKHPQRAIVIASILYLQNRKEKQNENT